LDVEFEDAFEGFFVEVELVVVVIVGTDLFDGDFGFFLA
jgi:hypothetical protein